MSGNRPTIIKGNTQVDSASRQKAMPIYSNYKNNTMATEIKVETSTYQEAPGIISSNVTSQNTMALTGAMPQQENQDKLNYLRDPNSSQQTPKATTPYHDKGRKQNVINQTGNRAFVDLEKINHREGIREQTTEYLQSDNLQQESISLDTINHASSNKQTLGNEHIGSIQIIRPNEDQQIDERDETQTDTGDTKDQSLEKQVGNFPILRRGDQIDTRNKINAQSLVTPNRLILTDKDMIGKQGIPLTAMYGQTSPGKQNSAYKNQSSLENLHEKALVHKKKMAHKHNGSPQVVSNFRTNSNSDVKQSGFTQQILANMHRQEVSQAYNSVQKIDGRNMSQSSSQFNDYVQKITGGAADKLVTDSYGSSKIVRKQQEHKAAQRYSSSIAAVSQKSSQEMIVTGEFGTRNLSYEMRPELRASKRIEARINESLKMQELTGIPSEAASVFSRLRDSNNGFSVAASVAQNFRRKGDIVKENKSLARLGFEPRNQRYNHMLKKLEIERHNISALMNQSKIQGDEYNMIHTTIQTGSDSVKNLHGESQDFQSVMANEDLRRLGPKSSIATQQYLAHQHLHRRDQEIRKASQSQLARYEKPGSLTQLALDQNYRMRNNTSALEPRIPMKRPGRRLHADTSVQQYAALDSNQGSFKNIPEVDGSRQNMAGITSEDQKNYQDFKERIEKQIKARDVQSESDQSASDEGTALNYEKDVDLKKFNITLAQDKTGEISLHKIALKPAIERTQEEIKHLVGWIQFRVNDFVDADRLLLVHIVEKLEGQIYKSGQIIFNQGDIGSNLFVIYAGECGVYKHKDNGKRQNAAVTVMHSGDLIGQKSLEDAFEKKSRSASVISHQNGTLLLSLTKEEYHSILMQYQVMERIKRQQYLVTLPFFAVSNFPAVKMVDFNAALQSQTIKQGEKLYDIGAPAQAFYIVKEGKIAIETVIEIESFYRFPIDKKRWEMCRVTQRILYKLKEVHKGQMFGHEEILTDSLDEEIRISSGNGDEKCLRVSRAVASANATVYYCNREDFLKMVPDERLQKLKQSKRSMDLEDIVSKISRQFMLKKLMNKALLDATGTNAHDFTGDRNGFIGNLGPIKKMGKLTPWLTKARTNKTKNKSLLHEIKKVQLLWTKEEKLQQEMGPESNQQLDQKRARFVLPDDTKKALEFQRVVGINEYEGENMQSQELNELEYSEEDLEPITAKRIYKQSTIIMD